MTHRRSLCRTRHAAAAGSRLRRGFSLVEVVAVAALSAVVLAMVFEWVLSLRTSTADVVASSAAQRDVAYVDRMITSDTARSRGCDPLGQDTTLRQLQTDEVGFYVTPDGSSDPAAVDLVLWRVAGGQLQRAELAGSAAACAFDETKASWTTVATGVTSGGPTFTGYSGGAPQTGDHPDCTGLAADGCRDDAVQVRLDVAADGGASAPLDAVYPLNTAGSAL